MTSIFSLFVLILIFHTEFVLAKERYNPIELEASLEKREGSIFLHVKLTNKEKILPFPLRSGVLPWESYNLFYLVMIPFVHQDNDIVYHSIIKQKFIMENPVFNLKFLFPGKTIEGYIALNERFSTKTMDSLKQKNLLICWGYPLIYGLYKTTFHWYQGYVISQTQESKKLLISEMLEETFNKKCSTVIVSMEKN